MTQKLTRGAAALALGLLGGVLAALAGGGRPAAAATLIQSCTFTIMQPGTYVLPRDLTCRGDGIIVRANNVNLVLAGHTLTTGGGMFGVYARNVTGLKITGGTVVGFNFGIQLDNTPDVRLTGVTATGNSQGIIVVNTTGAQLAGNTATNNDAGINLGSTTGALLSGNTATNNGSFGITLTSSSDSNRVVGNTATGNGSYGIHVQPGSTGNQILGNTATGNSPDLADNNPLPCVNTWQGNTFATTGGAGAACIR
jgi:parallel beta-helix repeat protein